MSQAAGQQIVLPKSTMRHTRASALRYQQKGPKRTNSRQQQQFAQSSGPGPNATVVSLNEFGYIAHLANKEKYVSQDTLRREELKRKSQERSKHWGNTIEALREKKVQERIKRLADVERRQQVIDDQEAAHQEGVRRTIIDRANALLYSENERVHRVHSGMQYSNVLAEREVQIRMKQRAKGHERGIEQRWADVEKQQMADYDRREEEKRQETLRKAAQRRQDQRTQLQQIKEQSRKDRAAEVEEGLRIREYTRQAKEEARASEAAQKQKMREITLGYARMNEEQKAIKAANVLLEREMDDKLVAFAKEKERVDRDRKANELRKAREKADAQAVLIKRQFDFLQSLQQKEEAQMQKDQDELERKELETLAREKARREQELQLTHQSRQQQIAARRNKLEREKMEEKIFLQNTIRNRKQMELLDEYNEQKTRESNKEHQIFLRKQMEINATNAAAARAEEFDFHEKRMAHAKREDEMYQEYTKQNIETYKQQGFNTRPIELLHRKEEKRQTAVNFADLGKGNGFRAFRD